MATIDSSIYFREKPVDVMGSAQKGMNMAQALQQMQANRQKLQDQQALREAAQNSVVKNPDGTFTLDKSKFVSNLSQTNPLLANQYGQQFKQQDFKNSQNDRLAHLQTLDTMARALGSVHDQNSYNAFLQNSKQNGWDTSDFGPQYNPQQIKDHQMQALSYKEQLANQARDRGLDLESQKIQASLANARASQAAKRETQSRTTDHQMNEDFIKLGNVAINPSSRRAFGRYQQNIDSADAVGTLLDTVGAEGKRVDPTHETRAQRIARYNKATPQQLSEVVKNLDRMLSQSAPTVEGMESLRPTSFDELAAKYGQKIFNKPMGANMGEFLDQIMHTVDRERTLNVAKQKDALGRIGAAFWHLKKYDPERFKKVIESSGDFDRHQMEQSSGGTSTQGPQVGSIEDGFKFLGGDPSNPKAWEKVGG